MLLMHIRKFRQNMFNNKVVSYRLRRWSTWWIYQKSLGWRIWPIFTWELVRMRVFLAGRLMVRYLTIF